MNHELPGYARAQAEWEAREPDDGGPRECDVCRGDGEIPFLEYGDDCMKCDTCNGFGQVAANGEPFDPDKAEREESENADYKRNQRDTDGQS